MRLCDDCELAKFDATFDLEPKNRNDSMRPTTRTTSGERRVMRWFFGVLAICVILLLGFTWHSRSTECVQACRAKGATGGELRFNRGGRLNLGSYCECAGAAN